MRLFISIPDQYASVPLLSLLLILGEFVLLSGRSLSVVRLVSREAKSKQKSVLQSHVSACSFNYFSRWRSTSQQMAHLAPLGHSARQALSWASDGEQRADIPQQTSSLCLICLSLTSRTSMKSRHGLNWELPEAVVLGKRERVCEDDCWVVCRWSEHYGKV